MIPSTFVSYPSDESVVNFLAIFNPERALCLTFDDYQGKDKDLSLLTTNAFALPDIPFDKLKGLNERGAGIFFTVNRTKEDSRKAVDISHITCIWVDMDKVEPNPEGLSKLPNPSLVVQSGSGKHLYWVLSEPVQVTNLEESKALFAKYQVYLADLLGGDSKVKDLPRVMRLPGFYHMKDKANPFLVKVISNTGLRYSLSDFPLPADIVASKDKPSLSTGKLEKQLNLSVARVRNAKEGARNDTLNKESFIVGGLVRKGLSYALAHEELRIAAISVGLGENEALSTIDSGLGSGEDKFDDYFTEIQQHKYIVTKSQLEACFKNRLRFNKLKNCYELDGERTTFIRLVDKVRTEVRVNKSEAQDFIDLCGDFYSYNPVTEYVNSLQSATQITLMPTLAKRLFDVDDYMSSIYLTRWLISAIARVLKPGCQADCALVLKGLQGSMKTTLFREFGKDDFFDTLSTSDKDKDELSKLSQFWILEYGELESAFKRKDVSEMKNFLSKKCDTYRAPYARMNETYDRTSVFCGTTNEDYFLNDETGARRFWVIDVGKKAVDFTWLHNNVDSVWAEAKKLYLDGEQWWLTPDEESLSKVNNEKHTNNDPWIEILQAAISLLQRNKTMIALTSAQYLSILLGVTPDKVNSSHTRRLAKVLRSLDYEMVQKTGGVRYWLHTDWDKEAVHYPSVRELDTLADNYSPNKR